MSFYVLKKTARPPAPVSPANPDWKSSSCLHHFPSWWGNFMPPLEVLSRNKGLFLLQIISQYCALSIKMWWAALGIIIYIASLNAGGRARAEAATPKAQKAQTVQNSWPCFHWFLNSWEIFTEHKEPEVPLVLPWWSTRVLVLVRDVVQSKAPLEWNY